MPKRKETFAKLADLKRATLDDCARREPSAAPRAAVTRSAADEKRRTYDAEDEREAREILQEARRTLVRAEKLVMRLGREDRDGGAVCKLLLRLFQGDEPAWWEVFSRTGTPRLGARASHTRESLAQTALLIERISGKRPDFTKLAVKSLLAGTWPDLRGKPTDYSAADVIGVEARAMKAAVKRAGARREARRADDLDD